tara:strand:- start:590 stop:781 length:192 start_codon:yes stop_codon:yes gene_type:complete
MKWVIVQNIPINYCPAVMGDEEGHAIRFDSKHEAEEYIEKQDIQPYIVENPENIMVVPEIETM